MIFYHENEAVSSWVSKKADGYLIINGDKYKISNNSAVFIPPVSKYKFDFNNRDEYETIVFNFDLFQTHAHLKDSFNTATEKSFVPENSPQYDIPDEFSSPIISDSTVGGELLWQCVDEFVTRKRLYRENTSALLKSFLIELLRENAAHGSSKLVSDIVDFIKENYSDPSLTNIEISSKFGYHPYYLSKLVKDTTGMSLKRYLIYYRIQISKDLLINTDASIEEISWRSGFGTSAYFIKCFRDNVGITPLAYRKSKQGASI